MRILWYCLIALLGCYALVVGALAYSQRRLIYPGVDDPPRQARNVPTDASPVELTTADGERLHALWIPPWPGCGVVVTFHGNGSLPEPHAKRFGSGVWRTHGWGVMAVAYRGYSGSTGAPSEAGLIEDGVTAYRKAAEWAPNAPILLHGHSLGAAIAVAVAQKNANIGLYLEAPFDSMSHTVAYHYPYIPSRLFLLDTYRSDRRITGGTEPVVIVAGSADGIVPLQLSQALAQAAGERARVTVIPGGDHMSILGVQDDHVEEAFRAALPACSGAKAG